MFPSQSISFFCCWESHKNPPPILSPNAVAPMLSSRYKFFLCVCILFQCYRQRNRSRSIKCVWNGFLLHSNMLVMLCVDLPVHSFPMIPMGYDAMFIIPMKYIECKKKKPAKFIRWFQALVYYFNGTLYCRFSVLSIFAFVLDFFMHSQFQWFHFVDSVLFTHIPFFIV